MFPAHKVFALNLKNELTGGRKSDNLINIEYRPVVEKENKIHGRPFGEIPHSVVERGSIMTYADFFATIRDKFMQADVSDVGEHLAFQFNITGEEAGIFYVELKDGQLHVEPYEYFDRDAMFTASADTLMKIAEGKTDPIKEFTLHRLKVEGNIDKALKLKNLIDSKR